MTLRLRLTLFYTLLVALVLSTSGLGLYFLLARNLYASLDTSLSQASDLLGAFVEREDGDLLLREEDEPVPELRADLVAALFSPTGRLLDSLGRVPQGLEPVRSGFSTWGDWRVYARAIPGGTLLTLREEDVAEESLEQFLTSFLTFAPLATMLAFGLGYLLAGRALKSVAQLTTATYDLANRHAWRERLPEPERRDELWRLAQGTNELLSALERVIERERRFTTDAAHELRTPLTVLRGRLEKASEQASDDKTKVSVAKALTASDALLELTDKLLVLARTEAGQDLTHEQVALDEIAFISADLLKPLFKEKRLTLIVKVPEMPVMVRGDRTALGLAVRNLLGNALKFTPKGEVALRLEANEGQATLTVEDTGPGIPGEALRHLFERFYQADVRHRRGGSGLGLALVKSVADAHGGTVRAENHTGGGARFTLKVPLDVPSG